MTHLYAIGRLNLAALVVCCCLPQTVIADSKDEPAMRVVIDARDLPRKLLHSTVRISVAPASDNVRSIALWYPKWVPGSHGPGGPVANVAGIMIEDEDGNPLQWQRTSGEVYRLEVDVPPGVDELRIRMRYIANQPSTNSIGHDVFGSALLGVISPGTVLLYREGDDIDEVQVGATLRLPVGWKASTALREVSGTKEPSTVAYQPATLRAYVDSPIMCGRHRRVYSLVANELEEKIPPHRLHVFSEISASIDLDEAIVEKLTGMVTQSAKLMGSHPFLEFDVLLAVTDQLPANGLEHARSTFNVLPRSSMKSPAALKGWNRLLIPHEYIHAWCGKYRRPAGMVTPDFHTAKGTSLLWVYEGLTQYLGEVVEARCGLMTNDEFRHRLNVELRHAMYQQGRKWRTLADTAAASHILRTSSPAWRRLRRSQDYYMEGMLLWLEIDGLLRTESEGEVTLDDFCRRFFDGDPAAPSPKAFRREDVVSALAALADYDWDGLIRRRVESVQEDFDPGFVRILGYRLESRDHRPSIPGSTFRHVTGIDAYDSLGATFSNEGAVRDLLLGSPADQAKLGPGMRIMGVNGRTWSTSAINDAIRDSVNASPIKLLVADGDLIRTVQLQYYDGPRYLTLVRGNGTTDLLDEILKPR